MLIILGNTPNILYCSMGLHKHTTLHCQKIELQATKLEQHCLVFSLGHLVLYCVITISFLATALPDAPSYWLMDSHNSNRVNEVTKK